MTTRTAIRSGAAILVIAAAAAGGYWWWTASHQPPPPRAAPGPTEVTIVETAGREVALSPQFAGRVAGFRVVEVRPQVGGILLKREFNEGSVVNVGDVLFRIDPRPFEATVARATAQVAQARATLTQAEENLHRTQPLAERGVSTQKALDDAVAARDQATATLQAAQADLETAKLNLAYTVITSPIKGPTSILSPPEGALVQAQQTLLTTITQSDPAYVNFTTTDREFREFQEMNRRRSSPIKPENLVVRIQFGDGTTHPEDGKLEARSQTVDPRTGTIQIRAVFPNHDGALLPGQFVRINILGFSMENAIVVPQVAISQGPQGPFVYVVDGNSNAQARPVKLDREVADGWIVRDGLKAAERIITNGVIRVRPGAPVKAAPAASNANGAGAKK